MEPTPIPTFAPEIANQLETIIRDATRGPIWEYSVILKTALGPFFGFAGAIILAIVAWFIQQKRKKQSEKFLRLSAVQTLRHEIAENSEWAQLISDQVDGFIRAGQGEPPPTRPVDLVWSNRKAIVVDAAIENEVQVASVSVFYEDCVHLNMMLTALFDQWTSQVGSFGDWVRFPGTLANLSQERANATVRMAKVATAALKKLEKRIE